MAFQRAAAQLDEEAAPATIEASLPAEPTARVRFVRFMDAFDREELLQNPRVAIFRRAYAEFFVAGDANGLGAVRGILEPDCLFHVSGSQHNPIVDTVSEQGIDQAEGIHAIEDFYGGEVMESGQVRCSILSSI